MLAPTHGNERGMKRRSGEVSRNTRCVVAITSSRHPSLMHSQKKTRGPALLKQHSAVQDADKARKDDEDEPPAIWDHSRDMALGGRLMDDKTRNKFISEARGLGDRFGSGKSGGFL